MCAFSFQKFENICQYMQIFDYTQYFLICIFSNQILKIKTY